MPDPDRSIPSSRADLLLADVCEELLDRAKTVASDITERVLEVIGPFPKALAPDDPTSPLRVLCVDDYPDAADALAAVLTLLGCDARACYNGRMAIDMARDFHPDVCLLDLMMPGMDGLHLATRLRTDAGNRPLILAAATALGSIEERTLTAVAGFHFHLVKPIGTDRMRDVIDGVRTLLHRL